MWRERVEDSLDAAAFLAGCEPRMIEAFAEMRKILAATVRLEETVPHLSPGSFLLCFCEEKCLDCHPLIPLLKMVVDHNPGSGLGILPHRGNSAFLKSLESDPTLPTLPAVILLSREQVPEKILMGRPECMDVVTWRTGKGWEALYRWLES